LTLTIAPPKPVAGTHKSRLPQQGETTVICPRCLTKTTIDINQSRVVDCQCGEKLSVY
jgi:hypothetical protein